MINLTATLGESLINDESITLSSAGIKRVNYPGSFNSMTVNEKQVRDIFCSFYGAATNRADFGRNVMPRWDGGRDKNTGSTYQSVWPKLVECLRSLDADPYTYIQLQFRELASGKPPYPNMLYGELAKKIWLDYKEKREAHVERELQADLNAIKIAFMPLVAKLGWPEEKAVLYALRDATCRASALMKYVVASEMGSYETCQKFEPAAISQYMLHADLYDKHFATRLPAALPRKAEEIRRKLSVSS